MRTYKISGFDDKTPQPKREKLQASLAAVGGVEKVELRPQQGQVSISCRPQQEAKPELIKAAVSKAGFSMPDKAHKA